MVEKDKVMESLHAKLLALEMELSMMFRIPIVASFGFIYRACLVEMRLRCG